MAREHLKSESEFPQKPTFKPNTAFCEILQEFSHFPGILSVKYNKSVGKIYLKGFFFLKTEIRLLLIIKNKLPYVEHFLPEKPNC